LIFLDTNVISEAVKLHADQRVENWLRAFEGQLVISAIVIAEISYGIESIRPKERSNRLQEFLAHTRKQFAGRIHPFDEESALVYGEIMGLSFRTGKHLTPMDGMIGAIAIRHDATLATRNVKDFVFLKMKLINPWAE
jgi:toxin FitB